MFGQEETSVTRKVLSSVLATGLAISLAGSAFAASGPGGDGPERTARKADQLLQGADALIKNDSPQRFGPERGFGNGTDKADEDRFSQKWVSYGLSTACVIEQLHRSIELCPVTINECAWKRLIFFTRPSHLVQFSLCRAGSGAIPELQDATSAQVSGARDKFASNVKKTQRRIDGIWGTGKGMANDVVATTQGKADDAAKGVKKAFGQATKSNAGNVAAGVKSKADEVTAPAKSSSGGFFGKIKQQAKGIQGAVASKGADVKDAIPNIGK